MHGTRSDAWQAVIQTVQRRRHAIAQLDHRRLLSALTVLLLVVMTPAALGAATSNRTMLPATGHGHSRSFPVTGMARRTNILSPAVLAVSLTPSSLNFGNQAVGTASVPQTITLVNTGSSTLFINSIGVPLYSGQSADFSVLTGTCVGSSSGIAPNGSCSFSVRFTPVYPGVRQGTLIITMGQTSLFDTALTQTVSLTGNALYPALSASSPALSPSSSYLGFGNQAVGASSAVQNLTLTNSGTAPLTIGNIALTGGNAGDFVLSSTNNCLAGPIAPNDRCTIGVEFKPTAAGLRSATLTITDNAADSPQNLVLSGNALYPVASLSPSSLDFGDQRVGTTSAAQNLNLTNTGVVPLTVTGATLGGINPADFRVTSVCISGLVGPNTKCAISVRFKPTSPGHRSAILRIRDNAVDSPQSVTLTGNGLPSRVTILPLTIHLPSAHVVGGGILRISVHTVARGLVTMTLQVATTRTVTTESGKHVTRTVVRYKRQVRGIADKHGQFTKGIRIDYKPVRPERLVVVVTVHRAQGIATGRVSVTILPLP